MALLIENHHQFKWDSAISLQVNQEKGISQTIISMIIEMQRAQIETNTKLDLFFKYFLNNHHKKDYQIDSFAFHYSPTPHLLQDKSSTRGSSSYSPCKRLLLSSKSFNLLKSPEYFVYTKRFTEDDKYSEEDKEKLKVLYRNKSDQNIKGRKKNINAEDNEEKQSVRYNNTSHRTSKTTRSNNLNSKGKIRGFNFRNKIETNNYNCYHSQPRRRATCDLFNSNHEIYDTYNPTAIMITNYNMNKNDSETSSNNKPQIVSEKQVKRYWNISISKPNKLQQKLKENFAKMINKKE